MKTEIQFREYQKPVFWNRELGVMLLHWSRQIGKSFTLAALAVDRLITRPGRLVTVLSNSRDNGAELNAKCAEVCQKLGQVFDQEDMSQDNTYENMNMETRVTVKGLTGRIKVLAANPRTARGFSGDLILDEFAFHENSRQIWEAAEPIISSDPDFLCRISSTGNGRHNMFYEMVTGGVFPVSRVTRTDAWKMGLKIYDTVTRAQITPMEARERALDKRAYDQNYECAFEDENMALLTQDLISAAERGDCGIIFDQDWTGAAQDRLLGMRGELFVGVDVGRRSDLTVMTGFEKLGNEFFARVILRCRGMRLPEQQKRLGFLCRLPKFRRAAIDMTGLGLGLVEYSQDEFGQSRIIGVDFGRTVPLTKRIALEGRKAQTVKITEAMATNLLQVYEDRRMRQPADLQLRDDLRKPEKQVSPGGRVSIAATRDEAGHADHFWSFALGVHAAGEAGGPFEYQAIERADGPGLGYGDGIVRRRAGRRSGILI